MNRMHCILALITAPSLCAQEPLIEPAQPHVNQEFTIKIPTERSVGLNWIFKEIRTQIAPNGRIVAEHLAPSSNMAWVIPYGNQSYENKANDTILFSFKALQPGTVILAFEKKHHYKNGKKVSDKKEIKVSIAQENIQKK